MCAVTTLRVFIILLLGFGLGTVPLVAGAQDSAEELPDLPAAADVETVSRGTADEAAEQDLGSISVSKGVCPEEFVPPNGFVCHGVNEAAVGTTVDFLLIGPDETGEEFWFGVEIENIGDLSYGTTMVTDVPPGTYELCESVPDGYEGFVFAGTHIEQTSNTCAVFEIGDEEDEQEVVVYANMVEEVDELPETGAGLTAPLAPGAWVPVLLAGTLLLIIGGVRLRTSAER